MAFATGYDMQSEFRFVDGLGRVYVGLAVFWSIILTCGSCFLLHNSEVSFVRIRNVRLTVSAVAILHVYWVLCLMAYGLNGFFPCATEFWIMNIYLPLGIALFHLSNTKLLHVAVLQRKFTTTDSLYSEKELLIHSDHGFRDRARRLTQHGTYKKTKVAIILGLIVQGTVSLIIFLISRKFHGNFGLVGQPLPDTPLPRRECRKGWEWIPSIIWQFLWSWLYAPYLLWKIRHIEDTHGWRFQTLVACVAGLPASPMWLLALYLPQMSNFSRYFIPPLWFAPSILLIEAFLIFQPCWQIYKQRRLNKETLAIIKQWQYQGYGSSVHSDPLSIPESPRRITPKSSLNSNRSERKAHAHMFTMAALDKALQTNPIPLLLFAALKDFTGENIAFLNHVKDWNNKWAPPRSSIFNSSIRAFDGYLRHRQFIKAIEIYTSFVSLQSSSFPINISYSHLKQLESMFEGPASIISAGRANSINSATPFDDFGAQLLDFESVSGKDDLSASSRTIESASQSADDGYRIGSQQSTVVEIYKPKELGNQLPQILAIPSDFGPGIFDNAMESVKYMVLTNTWPKFVNAGYAANMDKATPMEKLQDRLGGCGIGRSRLDSF